MKVALKNPPPEAQQQWQLYTPLPPADHLPLSLSACFCQESCSAQLDWGRFSSLLLGKIPPTKPLQQVEGVVFLSPRRAIFHLLLDAFLMTCMHIVWNKGTYAPHSFLSLYLSLLCLVLPHKRFRSETNSAQNLTIAALNNEIP